MIDQHGRRMRKLRISLLDACNLRCMYCMPENPVFLSQKEWASPDDIARIAANLVSFGIEEIRLTGGEPTLRKDFMPIVDRLSELPLQKLGLTTNAILLDNLLPTLSKTRCQHINISLDSLSSDNFHRITKRDCFDRVMRAILNAKALGFVVKLNVVMLRGVNDHELVNFVDFSAKQDVCVRFLEVMNIGVMRDKFNELFIPYKELLARLSNHYQLTRLQDASDSTAYNYSVSNGAQIGFIASQSQPFCNGCSRLRLTAKGHIRPCLFMDEGVDLKQLDVNEYPQALQQLINRKPVTRIEEIKQPMNQIGG